MRSRCSATATATGAILTDAYSHVRPDIRRPDFNPAVSVAMAFAPRTAGTRAAIYIGAQVLTTRDRRRMDRASHVRTAAGAVIRHGANRPRPMVRGGSYRHVRVSVDDLEMQRTNAIGGGALCRADLLHYGRLLVPGLTASFADPAVTIARSLCDTFAGIAPAGVAAFHCRAVRQMLAGGRSWPLGFGHHRYSLRESLALPRGLIGGGRDQRS